MVRGTLISTTLRTYNVAFKIVIVQTRPNLQIPANDILMREIRIWTFVSFTNHQSDFNRNKVFLQVGKVEYNYSKTLPDIFESIFLIFIQITGFTSNGITTTFL